METRLYRIKEFKEKTCIFGPPVAKTAEYSSYIKQPNMACHYSLMPLIPILPVASLPLYIPL